MVENNKHSILVVDDESSNIMKLTHILSPDYTIYAAKNGANGIKAAERYLPDIILLDIIMPDMKGYEVLEVLKESEKTKNIPVIFITGLSDADDEEKGLALGAADYLIKPFSPALVKVRVLNQVKLIEQFRTNEYDIMKYKLANDALNIALWDMDVVSADPVNPANRFVYSQEVRQMLGFADEDDFPNVVHSWSDRLHPDDKEDALGAFAAHINDRNGRTPYNVEYRLKLKGGGYRHFHAMGTTSRDKDGVPIRVAGALMDITEKKKMESEIDEFIAKIEADSHWYKSILDAIPLPVTVTDSDMNWTFVNKAVEDFLGMKFDDMIGKPCSIRNSEICGTENCGAVCAKRGLKQTFFTHEGASYQVDVEMLRDIAGEVAGFIEVVQDITNVQRLAKQQAEAEMTSNAKSAFLANMSHEIRTPMNAIWGITEILMQDRTLSGETLEALGRIHSSCNLLLGIINDILDLSKIEASKLEIMPAQYNAASLINDAVQLNIMRIGDKPIEFEVKIDEMIPAKLIGDELRIKQILNNILSNAFKYTDSGKVIMSGSFEYGKDPDKGTLLLCVEDTGHGMTQEQVGRIFDEYSRFNPETGRAIEGTGLGMAITRYLLNLMEGSVEVQSEPGKGSRFFVRLPQGIADSNVLGRELADNLRGYRNYNPDKTYGAQIIRNYMPYGKVLIVDDVETNLYVGEGLMKPYGLKVDTASSGVKAVEIIKSGKEYDIIFMDQMMPVMDGIEAAKRIRALGYEKPIVALTANTLVGQAEVFLKNGFDDFISKPIDIRRLNSVLNRLVRDRQPPEVVEAARSRTPEPEVAQSRSLLVESFSRDAYRSMAAIEETLVDSGYETEEGLRTFTVYVHGLKSGLANIGESALSEAARRLETAAREKNLEYIAASASGFMQNLRTLTEKLEKSKPEQPADGADKNIGDLRDKLLGVQKMCADYSRKAALDILAEINQRDCSKKTREIIDNITELVMRSEYDKAAEAAGICVAGLVADGTGLTEIPGINISKGLERYEGDEQVYLKILRSYAASVRSMLGTVERNDPNEYEITVHGIKGASYSIFADEVGDAAKALEMAAKSGDLDYIAEHNGAFLETAHGLIDKIEDMLAGIDAATVKEVKPAPDNKILAELLAACRTYDMDGADAAMAEIEKYRYENDGGLADWLRESVDLINFEEIAERLSYLDDSESI